MSHGFSNPLLRASKELFNFIVNNFCHRVLGSRGTGSTYQCAFMKKHARSVAADTENARKIHEQAP